MIAFVRSCYRLALRALPSGLRARHGADMEHDFLQLARTAARQGGKRDLLALTVHSIADVLQRAPGERAYERRMEAARDIHSTYIPATERFLRMLNDLRVAARTLARRPGFSFVVMVTLALGIGANVAIFAVVNAVLIKPLPYPKSERIVVLAHHAPGLNLPELENSPGSLQNYSKNARSFSAIATASPRRMNLTGEGEPEQIEAAEVTASMFDVLQVRPAIGRRMLDSDTVKGAPAVAVLTYRGWTKFFGGQQNVIGKSIRLDGEPTEIIGVMPEGFAFPREETMALVPAHIDYSEGYGSFGIKGLARLAPGVTLEAAQREVTALQKRIPELDDDMNAEFLKKAGWNAEALPLQQTMVKDIRKTLWIVLGTVSFLLLVACASVANLFLVRAEGRGREVGVRFALGATRARVASTFISESVILGVAGGAWGMLIAWFAVRALLAASPPEIPRLNEISIDVRVMLFGAVVSVLAGILFGILPLPGRMRRPLGDLVRGGRADTVGRDRQAVRQTLIVAQIALALMLLVGSGLMLRSFQRLRAVDPGLEPDGVLTMGVSIPVESQAQASHEYARIAQAVGALPGVVSAGAANSLPLDPKGLNGGSFTIRSAPELGDGEIPPVTMYAAVTDGFFETLRTPIVQGRDIDRSDVDHGRAVILVNETFAKSYLKDRVLGEEIHFGRDSTWRTVIGVVKDLRTEGLKEDVRPMAYLPLTTEMTSVSLTQVTIAVRTKGDPATLMTDMRTVVRRMAPDAPVTNARTMNEVLSLSTAQTSLTMTVLALAAGVALLLGAIGLYGVINYVVAQRTREIGVRIALGAMPASVGRMVLRQGLALATLGTVVGLLGAFLVSKVLESILFEVDSHDPLTFSVVPLILLAVSALAAYLPARKAASVSPMEALRSE